MVLKEDNIDQTFLLHLDIRTLISDNYISNSIFILDKGFDSIKNDVKHY